MLNEKSVKKAPLIERKERERETFSLIETFDLNQGIRISSRVLNGANGNKFTAPN